MKLCVLFPGMGYHCDKPLLYFSARLAEGMGFDDVIRLTFSGFDNCGDPVGHAYEQCTKQLDNVAFKKYDEILFIGKSIGTVVCQRYREERSIKARSILLTPLEQTFEYPADDCIAFHGTADPIAKTPVISSLCENNNVVLYKYADANHSLEVREAFADIQMLDDVMKKIKDFI